jgi:hypothetical protein
MAILCVLPSNAAEPLPQKEKKEKKKKKRDPRLMTDASVRRKQMTSVKTTAMHEWDDAAQSPLSFPH